MDAAASGDDDAGNLSDLSDDFNAPRMKSIAYLAGLARYILSPECKSVVMLTGAGVSVASGIPDFRSPGGMYDTLRPELITATDTQRRLMAMDPTYVVEKTIFMRNAFPYLEVRRPFILGVRDRKWKPTIAHQFASLLHSKTGKLTRVYTQNIDGLTYEVGLPDNKIVSVHGDIGRVACESCGAGSDFDEFCDQVERSIRDIYDPPNGPAQSTPIRCASCGAATVKPRTVLFGAPLPSAFFDRADEDLPGTDLLIVAGTSLVVGPANTLVQRVPDAAQRVIINNEPVGRELGIDYGPDAERDYFARGACDEVFLDLVRELGWIGDLEDAAGGLSERSAGLIESRKGADA